MPVLNITSQSLYAWSDVIVIKWGKPIALAGCKLHDSSHPTSGLIDFSLIISNFEVSILNSSHPRRFLSSSKDALQQSKY